MIAAGMQFGRYEVGARLGTGGFGVVHHARDVELGRDIAIKFLKPLYMTRPPLVQRFLREARAAAKIGHPGIVTVFECGQVAGTGQREDGNVFIAMELLRGESLADRLERAGRLSPALAISIGRQLASALAAAHKAGIVHRDLKPDNVFLVPDPAVRGGERAKILDFGIAKLTEPQSGLSTHSQVILGTPGYMSPEQARSPALVDHRSDIYALGCILFEALCGRAPYCGDPSILIALHQSAPVPSTRTSAPTTPIDLDRLITSMLAKAPEDRPDSMDAIAETLGAYESTSRGVLALGPMPEPEPAPIDPFEPTGEATILRPSLSRIQLRRRAPIFAMMVVGGLVLGGALTYLVVRRQGPPVAAARGEPATEVAATHPAPRTAATAPPPPAAARAPNTPMRGPATPPHEAAPAPHEATTPRPEATTPPSTPSTPTTPTTTPAPANEGAALRDACAAHQRDHDWPALAACAEQLRAVDPDAAGPLAEQAALELRSVAQVAAIEAALRDRALDRARLELEQLSRDSASFEPAKQQVERAEAVAIDALVRRLRAASGSDCRDYAGLLRLEAAAGRQRVSENARKLVRCDPVRLLVARPAPGACDARELADAGKEAFSDGNNAQALALFEKSIACAPDPDIAMRALVAACAAKDLPRARQLYLRLSEDTRHQVVAKVCTRYGIGEDQLAP